MEYRNAEFKCYNKYPNYPAVCKLLRPERLCSTAVACTAALHAVERPSRPAKAGRFRSQGPAKNASEAGKTGRRGDWTASVSRPAPQRALARAWGAAAPQPWGAAALASSV